MSQFNLQRTFDFIRSIDKPETILVFFDFGAGNDLIDFALKPLTDFFLTETKYLTLRIGGLSSRYASYVIRRGEVLLPHIHNPKRFEMYFSKYIGEPLWADIRNVAELDIENYSDYVEGCPMEDVVQIKGYAPANIRPATHVMFDLYRMQPKQLKLVDDTVVKHCYMSSRFRLKRAIRMYPDLINQVDSLLWGHL